MEEWTRELNRLQEDGLYRNLQTITTAQTPTTVVDGQEVIMLASNNYLGLTNNREVKDATIEVIREYGTGAGGSRLTTGNYDLHEQLEEKIAQFKGTEAALVFNTGYMANLGVLSTVLTEDDLILSDQLNHASIIDGCKLGGATVEVYQHGNPNHLEEKLRKNYQDYNNILIVSDGVFSMDGDLAPVPEIVDLATEYNALVMIDDAHGTGVVGAKGKGVVDYFDLVEEVDIQVGTLSKALAGEGGFVAGSQELIDLLRNKARSFIYSTALAPGTIASSLTAINYLEQHQQLVSELHTNINFLKSSLEELGYQLLDSSSAIIPIMIGSEKKALQLSQQLLDEGVLAPAIRPPTVPEGTSRIRATVMANHSHEDLREVVDAFALLKK